MQILSFTSAKTIGENSRDPGCVYFAQCRPAEGFLGPIKVSATRNLQAHLQALVANNPFPVYLLGWVPAPDPERLEKQLHVQFAAARVRGDWFQAVDELMTFVKQHATRPIVVPPVAPQAAMLTVEQLAELLKVSVPTIRRLVADGSLPFHRVGKQIRFVREDVLRVISTIAPADRKLP